MKSNTSSPPSGGPARRSPKGGRRPRLGLALSTATLVGGVCLSGTLAPAVAQEFRLHLEPAAAFWLDTQQSDRFGPGVYFAVRPSVTLGPVLSLQAAYAMFWTPAGDGYADDGSAHMASGGVRLRPLASLEAPADHLAGLFVDGNASYVRTGDIDRFGFDFGLGYNFQMAAGMAIGPVVRYTQIVQSADDVGLDDGDGQLLSVGLNLTFGPAYVPPTVPPGCPEHPEVPECIQHTQAPAPAPPCADADGDGVCDGDDRCPTMAGPKESFGCPTDVCSGRPLVMLVQFKFDSSEMPGPREGEVQTMDPVLDAVSAAIAKDPACRVCVIGHASEEGDAGHNLELSRARATAVQGYMTARGLSRDRIPAKGMGVRCPLVPENTLLANRRVEFRRLLEGDACPSDCEPAPPAPLGTP